MKHLLPDRDLAILLSDMKPRHILFAEEYMIDMDGQGAALRAGYVKGSNQHTTANRLLKRKDVKKYVRHMIALRQVRTNITADRVILELAKIAFSDVADLVEMNDEGYLSVKDFDKMKYSAVIKDIKIHQQKTQSGETAKISEVKTHDKMKAIELLGKHMALFTDNLDVTTKGDKLQQNVTVEYHINHRAAGQELIEE